MFDGDSRSYDESSDDEDNFSQNMEIVGYKNGEPIYGMKNNEDRCLHKLKEAGAVFDDEKSQE